ncbi:MAG: hypothetical protein RJB66_690 [Pseudomonadota bacterium]|jgi:HAD superfamily hydrolase (TIGR01509 family)
MMRPNSKKVFDSKVIKDFDALLFDMDGTLIDSMPAHNRAWQMALAEFGVTVSNDELLELAGTPNKRTAEIFIDRYSILSTAETIVRAKEELFERAINNIDLIQSVATIAQSFFNQKALGLVSGSDRQSIHRNLRLFQLEHLFSCIVSSGDTVLGKPSPDPYLLAAQLLKVEPHRCLVFEDGHAGILSAKQAGMNVILIENGLLYHWESK